MKEGGQHRRNGNKKKDLLYSWETDIAPPRVLVAEDDEVMRSLLVDAMRDRGFEVVEAKDGNEALEKAVASSLDPNRYSRFDIIVLDVHTSGPTGLEVLAHLRDTGLNPAVIILSAFISDAMYVEADRLGCVAVIRKPFSLEQLMSIVKDAAGCSVDDEQ